MASIQFTEADRDERGFVRTEPRSLADLLPPVEAIKQDVIVRQPLTRGEIAALVCVALCAVFVIVYAWATPTAPPVARPTVQPTARATLAPTAAPTALVAYFDYRNTSTAASIDPAHIERVVGQAGAWRLVTVGGARVWVEETQVPGGVPVDSPLPDLAPRTPIPQVAPQAPVAPPQVERCAEAGVPGKMVRVCGDGDLEAQARDTWLATYGGNIGQVGAPTPQVQR